MSVIYILRLIQNKFYVGQTINLQNRLHQHRNKIGSAWTRKYPMVDLIESIPAFRYGELATTLTYMDTYGVENVRGAIYSNVQLTKKQKQEIELHIRHERSLCLVCGKVGHYAHECPTKRMWKRVANFFSCCQAENDFEYKELNDSEHSDSVLNFGKHKGQTYEDVWKNHQDYCRWVLTQDSESERFNTFKAYCETKK